MSPTLSSILLYTRKTDEMAAFYCNHFGYTRHDLPGDRIVELRPAAGGAVLLLHPASKGIRQGQAAVKLVFTIRDVPAFVAECAKRGLEFGALHKADGYVFANAKDPSGNSVSISGRLAIRDAPPDA
ncbi:VOC family protein [uncultured Roseobacter sp.]|uniref:VOC family protein n=1 Tax=uncultured Roseobacter sp. TaxID=114847 RepID=UPI0026147C57|nr:VOC family protein [uncultured Roseobacter sp.]